MSAPSAGVLFAKRLVVAAAGGAVLLLGMAMIVLPGPAVIVVPLGLGILATEFVWARSLLDGLKNRASLLMKGRGHMALSRAKKRPSATATAVANGRNLSKVHLSHSE